MDTLDGQGQSAPGGLKILYNHRTRSRDGQSIHIDELIHALRAEGHTVIVVEPERVDAMASTVERKLLPKFAYELAELGYSILEFAKLARAVLRHKPHAFYQRANLYMLSGVWLARLFGLPYLLEVNAPLAQERGKFGGLSWPRLAAWTERTMWRNATVVLPVTKVLGRYVTDAGVPEARIVVTPNGVDVSRFAPIAHALRFLDHYLVSADFDDYYRTQRAVDMKWHSPEWTRSSILNVARMAWFSSDRTIREYAEDIWNIPLT